MNSFTAEKVKANKKVEKINKNKNKNKNKKIRVVADVRKAAKLRSLKLKKQQDNKIVRVEFEAMKFITKRRKPTKVETKIIVLTYYHIRHYLSYKSSISFLDSVTPYINDKNNYITDIKMWKGKSDGTTQRYSESYLRTILGLQLQEYSQSINPDVEEQSYVTPSDPESEIEVIGRVIFYLLGDNISKDFFRRISIEHFNYDFFLQLREHFRSFSELDLNDDLEELEVNISDPKDLNAESDSSEDSIPIPRFHPRDNGVSKIKLPSIPFLHTDTAHYIQFKLPECNAFKEVLHDITHLPNQVYENTKHVFEGTKEILKENESTYLTWYEDFKKNLINMLSLHDAKDAVSYIDYILSSVYFIYQSVYHRSKKELAATLMMLMRNSFPTVTEFVSGCITDYIQEFVISIPNKVKSESFPDIDETFSPKKLFEMVISSQIVKSTRSFIINMVGLKFFDPEMSKRFISTLGEEKKSVNMIDFTYNMIEVIESFTRFGVKFYKTGSVIAALLDKDIIAQFIDDTTDIALAFRTVYIGDDMNFIDTIAKDRMSATVFLRDISEFINKGDKYLTSMKVNPIFKTRLSELKMMKRSIMMEISSKRRMAPIGIILHGDPGIGKSSILTNIYKSFCYSTKRKYSSDLVFNRAPKAKYWTGYDPIIHPIIHIPELGNVSSMIAQQGDESINEMLCVVDNAPFCPDQAAIEDKGVKYAIPELVCIDTNNPDMNLKVLMAAPAAIRRRFLYIEAFVKDEFKIVGGVGLDSSKITPETDKMNLWNFKVYKMVPQVGDANIISTKISYTHDGEGDKTLFDMFTLCQFLDKYHAEHVANQKLCSNANDVNIEKYMQSPLKEIFSQNINTQSPIHAEDDHTPSSSSNQLYMPMILLESCMHTFLYISYFVLTLYVMSRSFISFFSTLFFQFSLFFFLYEYVQYRSDSDKFLFSRRNLNFVTDTLVLYRKITYSNFFVSTYNISYNLIILSYLYFRTFFVNDDRYSIVKWKVLSSKIKSSIPPLLLMVTVSAASVKILLLSYKMAKDVMSEGISHSGQYNAENIYRTVADNEKQSFCAFPLPSKKKNSDMDYDHVENITPVLVGTERNFNKIEEINSTINSNIRYVKIRFLDDSTTRTKILGICNDYALINKHCIRGEIYSIHISTKKDEASGIIKSNLSINDMKLVGEDIYLIRIIGTYFKDISFAITNLKPIFSSCRAMFMDRHLVTSQTRETLVPVNSDDMSVSTPFRYIFPEHQSGDCGTPLVVSIGYKTFLVGIHCAGSEQYGYACTIDKELLDLALCSFKERNILVDITSEGCFRLKDSSNFTKVSNRSPLVFEDIPSLLVYGNIDDHKQITPKSTLTKSVMFDHVEDIIKISPLSGGFPKYLPPKMRCFRRDGIFYSPENNFVKKIGVVTSALDNKVMENVVLSMTTDLLVKLYELNIKEAHPVPLEIAQNGFPENFYYRSMKNSTSGGFMFTGQKNKYLDKTPKNFKSDAVTPKPEVLIQVSEIIDSYLKDESSHSIVGAQLKDEPRSREKVLNGNTRMFAMSSYDMTLVNRMYLLPFYTLMCEHRDIFNTKIGINMHSSEVDDMYNSLKNFSSNIMEGDYGGYDTSMPIGIGVMANSIVYNILKKLGYNTHSLQIVRGILTDNLFPTVVLNGTVFTPPGFQPSGKYATAEDNSLRGVILLRYAFAIMCTPLGYNNALNLTTHFSIHDFKKLLLPITYGDDMLCGVKDELAPFFNNITYEKFVREMYYMTFTTSDKKEQTQKFIKLKDISFLKRSFEMHSHLKRMVAPLDKDSIMKSLCYYLPSKEITPEDQLVQTCMSALTELFFHSKTQSEYDEYRNKFIHKLSDLTRFSVSDLEPLFKTWDLLLEKYSL